MTYFADSFEKDLREPLPGIIAEAPKTPLGLPAKGQERFHLRGHQESAIGDCVVERFDAISISCREE